MMAALTASAQKYPERSLVRRGNRAYDRGRYELSIERYTKALEAAPGNWEALYDMGNALAAAERSDKAEETLRAAAADTLRSGDERAEAYFNLGNVQLSQQKLQEALESYKSSLRMNPSDEEAKYNYVYVKRLLDNQQGGGGGDDQQNQDQNQNGDDRQQGQQGDNGDQNDQKGDGQQDPQQEDNQEQKGNPDRQQDGDGKRQESPAEPRISEQEQERMLEAIQAEEDKTQDKLKDKVRGVVVKGRKNW